METALFGIPNLGIFADLAILIGLLLLGVPAPFAFMAALVFLVYTYGFEPTAQLPMAFHKLKAFTLLSVPFFPLSIAYRGRILSPQEEIYFCRFSQKLTAQRTRILVHQEEAHQLEREKSTYA